MNPSQNAKHSLFAQHRTATRRSAEAYAAAVPSLVSADDGIGDHQHHFNDAGAETDLRKDSRQAPEACQLIGNMCNWKKDIGTAAEQQRVTTKCLFVITLIVVF